MIRWIFQEKKYIFHIFVSNLFSFFQIGESHTSHTSFGRARMFASSGACGLGDRLSSRRQRQPSMLGLWPSLSLSQLVAFQQIGGEWIRTSTRVGGSVLFNCGISYKWTSGKDPFPFPNFSIASDLRKIEYNYSLKKNPKKLLWKGSKKTENTW